jgi:hypothetical protein
VINEIMYHHAPNYGTPGTPGVYDVTTPVPISSTWRYNQTGQNLGVNWEDATHSVDNVSWFSGPALIAYEVTPPSEPIRTTLVNPQTVSPFIFTYYFETDFNFSGDVNDPKLELLLRHMIDDGAVFYLNGQEIARFRMADGVPTSSTPASELTTEVASVGPFVVPKTALVVGPNRLSVEVHQFNNGSSDIVFGAELTTRRELSPPVPGDMFAESNEEWIELYNRGLAPVDLTGWKINGGVDFDFPVGTTIDPGAYLVVANDATALAAKYPGVTIIGNLAGQLSNRNDLIRLDDANENPADEVHYYDSGRWGEAADGNGSSLELVDVDADNSKGEAWAASIESDDSQWQTISYRGVAGFFPGSNEPTTWNELVFNLLDAGEFLVDDISVIESPSGTPIQRIQNGNFNSGATAYRLVGNHGGHGLSGVIPEPGNPTNNVLYVVATGAGEHMSNHVETTFAGNAAIVNGREYEISMRVKWLSGSPQLNTRLYFNRLAQTHILDTPQDNGTPGAANSRALANIGPTYDDLQHAPVIPQPGQAVTVSVRAADPQGVANMVARYSVNGGAAASVPMTLSPDGRYKAIIPGQSAAAIVQFYVEGTDGAGGISYFPAAGPDSRALYKVADGAFTGGGRNNFRAIMTEADRARLQTETNVMSNHRMPGTVVWNERQVYYDAGIRLKGSGFSRANAGAGHNIRFQPDQPFMGVHEVVAIDPIISTEGRGASHRELIIKHIANAAGGIPMMYDDVINWIAPQGSQNTAAQLLAARYDDEFTSNQFEDGEDGTRFKLELIYYSTLTADGTPQGLKRPPAFAQSGVFPVLEVDYTNMGDDSDAYRWNHLIRNNRSVDDYSRIIEMGKTFALSGSTVGSQLDIRSRAVIDVDQWMRVFAYESLAGINDTYNQGLRHNFQVFVRPEDQRVLAMPWDQDFALHHDPTGLGIYGSGSNFRKIIDIPSNRRLFQGHLQDIINTTYNTTYLAPWIAEYGAVATVNRTSEITNYITARRNYVLSQLMAPVTFAITTNGGANFSVTTPTVTLEGNGWINVREIRLAGSPSPVDLVWTDQDSWRATIPVSNGANPLVLQAYDFQGNFITSDSITVNATYTAPDPLVHLRLTELMYHPPDPTAAEAAAGYADADEFEYIELQNISTGPLNLAGLKFSDGIDFDFSTASVTTLDPGEHLVIVENIEAFKLRYNNPNVIIAGQYTGRLDNGGEHVRLENSAGAAIHDFTYDDNGVDWHASTDGLGPSLVISQPSGDKGNWGLPAGWRPSLDDRGSPGREDFLPGDVNGDRRADAVDLAIIQANLGLATSATRGQGDLDGDGAVSRRDVARLAQGYAQPYPAPSPASAPSAVFAKAAAAPESSGPATLRATRRPRLPARSIDAAFGGST